jgi:hypothetical protein
MFSPDVGLHEHWCTPDGTHSDRVVTHEFQDSGSEDICLIKVFLCILKSLQRNVGMGNGFFHMIGFQDILTSATITAFLPDPSLMTSTVMFSVCFTIL